MSRRLAPVALAALTLAACQGGGGVREDVRASLADGVRAADSLTHLATTSPERLDDVGIVALGYLERARLGLGSPFRLADAVRDDLRLPPPLGRRLAWALLDAARRGATHQADAAALGDDPPTTASPARPPLADGALHRAVVDSVVRAAPDARTGEGIVRLGYSLARAERLVGERAAAATVHAAALARDRRLAAEDADVLLRAVVARPDSDALDVLRARREARTLRSELPLLADALRPDDAAVAAGAERLLLRLRRQADAVPFPADLPDDSTLARVDSAAAPSAPSAPAAPTPEPGIPVGAARRLADLPSVRSGYPSAALTVTLGGFRRDTYAPTPGQIVDETLRRGLWARARLAERARNDEALAAEWALLRATLPADGAARRELGALVAAAVVATRPGNQTPVTLPAPASASTELLALRDGVRSVQAAADVSPEWRDAATREIARAVGDLRIVFPAVGFDGLSVRLGESPRGDRVLALHDPSARMVWLPPLTAAGTVAHELAHDLDWQAARTRLAVRGTYATDRAARTGRGGALAAAVRTLADTRPRGAHALGAAPSGTPHVDHDRPAERFARGADFLTAAALARAGRMNATLSSVQDEVLAGYAGVVAPEPGDGSAEALLDVTEAITPVPPATRSWFLARFGVTARPGPLAVARTVLETTPDWRTERALRAAGVPGALVQPDLASPLRKNAATCVGMPEWRDRVRWLAADARARGILRERAPRAASVGWGSWSWPARALVGGPWRSEVAEASVARLRDALLRSAAADQRVRPGGVRQALVPACG